MLCWFLGTEYKLHPAWVGFMEPVMQNTWIYDASEIRALPFINMNPSDSDTIYTALCYAGYSDKAG